LSTTQALSKANKRYEEILRAKPFNPTHIIEAKNNVTALKAGLKELEELKKLF
jgi:hypothetical protein